MICIVCSHVQWQHHEKKTKRKMNRRILFLFLLLSFFFLVCSSLFIIEQEKKINSFSSSNIPSKDDVQMNRTNFCQQNSICFRLNPPPRPPTFPKYESIDSLSTSNQIFIVIIVIISISFIVVFLLLVLTLKWDFVSCFSFFFIEFDRISSL